MLLYIESFIEQSVIHKLFAYLILKNLQKLSSQSWQRTSHKPCSRSYNQWLMKTDWRFSLRLSHLIHGEWIFWTPVRSTTLVRFVWADESTHSGVQQITTPWSTWRGCSWVSPITGQNTIWANYRKQPKIRYVLRLEGWCHMLGKISNNVALLGPMFNYFLMYS